MSFSSISYLYVDLYSPNSGSPLLAYICIYEFVFNFMFACGLLFTQFRISFVGLWTSCLLPKNCRALEKWPTMVMKCMNLSLSERLHTSASMIFISVRWLFVKRWLFLLDAKELVLVMVGIGRSITKGSKHCPLLIAKVWGKVNDFLLWIILRDVNWVSKERESRKH